MTQSEILSTFVTLKPAFRGPTAGYQAMLVSRYECEWTGEDIDDVLRYGPFSDALLLARGLAIDWASSIGKPYRD